MKHFLVTLFITVVTILGAYAEPVIVFDTDSVDVGTITDETAEMECSFFFCNETEEPYIINRIETSCRCDVTHCSTAHTESGYMGYIIATVNFEGLKNGRFSKHIYLYSNTKTIRLVIYGEIDFPVKVLFTPKEE